jgi:hypothetical protein
VNVNTASEAVLECLPGITPELADAIISARQSNSTNTTDMSWVIPILTTGGATVITQAGPFLTGKSYQVTADVAAVGRNGRGYRRTRFIIDTSNNGTSSSSSTGTTSTSTGASSASGSGGTINPQIVYRRDISHLGWALGPDARQSLANLRSGS